MDPVPALDDEQYVTWDRFAQISGLRTIQHADRNKIKSVGAYRAHRVDLRHDYVVEFVERRAFKRRNGSAPFRKPLDTSDPFATALQIASNPKIMGDANEILADMIASSRGVLPDNLGEMTLRDAIDKYGSFEELERIVKALKQHAEMIFRETKNEQTRGNVIPRDTVTRVVFPLIELMFNRCVGDGPEAVADMVVALMRRGSDNMRGDVVDLIRREYTTITKSVKEEVSDSLRRATGGN